MRVEFANVDRYYGRVAALRSVSVHIPSGDFITVVGPSGSGKTTFLRIMAGLTEPTSGEVLFDGKSALGIEPSKRNVSMVFQRYALYPLTTFQNLALPLKALNISRDEVTLRVTRIARILNIEPLLARPVNQLSGGEQQRVALGRALVREPALFLLDEPLSNLDPTLRNRLAAEIDELQGRLGVTTVMVTHDPAEAMILGRQIIVFDRGRLVQYAAPDQLFLHPVNRFVAEFTSNYRISFVRCTLRNTAGIFTLCMGDHVLPLSANDSKSLRFFENQALEVAVRPEHVHLNPNGTIRGTVRQLRPGGSGYTMMLDTALGKLETAVPAGVHLYAGSTVQLEIRPDARLVFDVVTGESIYVAP